MSSSISVDEVVGAILAAMRRETYAELSVALAGRCLARLAESCGGTGGQYTPGIGALFAGDLVAARTGRVSEQRRRLRGRLVRLADSYVATGRVDLSVASRRGPMPCSPGYQQLLCDWEARIRHDGWADETLAQHVSYARRWLLYLERDPDVGGNRPGAGDAEGFLVALRATCAPSSMRTIKNVLAAFAQFAGWADLAEVFSQVRVERKRSPLPVLGDGDMERVVRSCQRASLRDAAITVLALTTGLRAVDICALGLGDIDWRTGQIGIIQRKTGNPLAIPLPPAAGNAIASYLLDGRPATSDRHVFLRSLAPYTGLSGHSAVRGVIKKVFNDAEVAPPSFGTRWTRHSLASAMLSAQVAHPTIAAVLGHSDPKSVDAYLEMDVERMRACVLPLPEGAKS
jgi:integrase